jgi:hypothetical protein
LLNILDAVNIEEGIKNALLSAENAEKKCKTFRQSTYLQEARMDVTTC